MRLLLLSTVAGLTLSAGAASAQSCTTTGTDVSCVGAPLLPFSSGADDLDVTLAPGAAIDDSAAPLSEDALELDGDRVEVFNAGAVISTGGGRAIDGGDGLLVRNGQPGDTAEIRSTQSDALRAGDDLSLVNNGTVVAGDDGVQAEDGASVVNAATAVLQAADKGITAEDGLSVINHGSIVAGTEGIEGGDKAVIENSGTIFAYEDGVQVDRNGTITNSGRIESSGGLDPAALAMPNPVFTTEGDGIDIDDGSIFNSGSSSLIQAANGAGIDVDGNAPTASDPDGTGDLVIYNEGTIRGRQGILVETVTNANTGSYANTSAQNVVNLGLIEGTGGTALNLGAGDDSVTNFDGSSLVGETLLGGGADLLYFASLEFTLDGWDALFDGGADADDVRFAFGLSRLLRVEELGQAVRLVLWADAAQTTTFDLLLSNFETASFDRGNGTFETIALPGAVIPLPATGVLLGAALLGLARRRRRSVAP